MNAAARLAHHSVLTRPVVLAHFFGRQISGLMLLIGIMIASALSVIYVTQTTRDLNAAYQQSLVEQNQLHAQHNKLLLERSTWMMQARLQQEAERNYGMIVPEQKSIIIIHG